MVRWSNPEIVGSIRIRLEIFLRALAKEVPDAADQRSLLTHHIYSSVRPQLISVT